MLKYSYKEKCENVHSNKSVKMLTQRKVLKCLLKEKCYSLISFNITLIKGGAESDNARIIIIIYCAKLYNLYIPVPSSIVLMILSS